MKYFSHLLIQLIVKGGEKTKSKRKLLLGILIIFSILIFLSNVSAEDTGSLAIQDSPIDADLSTQDVSIDEEPITGIDNVAIANQDSTNASPDDYSDENLIKNSSSLQSSKLGKDISVGGTTFKDIQDAIDRADSGDTIYLNGGNANNMYTGSGTHITINKPITIIGNSSFENKHVFLYAQVLSRMFYITANDVTLINIEFYSGEVEENEDPHGGAIYWGGSNGIIKNCAFKYNSAISTYELDFRGGAIYYASKTSNQHIENCVFANNSAYNGGAIYLQSSYSTILNCTFDSNYGRDNGRATGSTGSCIYLIKGNNNNILNCNFLNNVAITYAAAINIVTADDLYIFNCSFKNNSAGKAGGAIEWEDDGNGVISTCYFENNRVIGSDGTSRGGAIFKRLNGGSIINSKFVENSAATGSAIYSISSFTIDNCTFLRNNAGSEGAIAAQSKNLVINNSIFDNNYAKNYGAAIYTWSDSASIVVENSRFINNHVGQRGGAIFFYGKNCQISDSLFENNRVDDNYVGFGGAIYIEDTPDSSSIVNCSFNANYAIYGGAIYWMNDTSKKAVIANSTFEHNSAVYGGAIAILHNLNLIANSTFINNKANTTSLTETSQSDAKIYTFTGNEDYMNAIKTGDSAKVNFQNVTYWDGSLVSSDSPIKSNKEAGINITIGLTASGQTLTFTKATNINGQVVFDEYKSAPFGKTTYTYVVIHPDDSYYTQSNYIWHTLDLRQSDYKKNTLKIDVADAVYGEDLVVNLSTNVSGDYTIYIANSSYDVTFTNDDVSKGNVLAYKVSVSKNELNGKVIQIPALLDAKDGYGAYVQFTNDADGAPYMYSRNRTSFNVYKAASSLDANGTTILNGSDAELNYTAVNGTVTVTSIKKGNSILENGTDYTFAVSDDKVIISGLDSGKYSVNLTTVVDANHNLSSKEVTVNVLIPTSIDAPKTVNLFADGLGSIVATLNPHGAGSLTFESGNESIVTVDGNGNLIPKGIGKANVTVRFAGDEIYAPSSATVLITVVNSRVQTSIEVNDTFDLHVNDQVNMGASLDPSNAGELDYASSNESVVTVDEDGNMVAKGVGEANITVSFAGNDDYYSSSTEVLVKVHPLVDLAIVKTVNNQTPYYADTVTYTITVTNNGPNAATDVVVTDTVPSGMNVSSADDTYVGNGVWEIASIDSGSKVSLTLYATVNSLDSLTNEVNVTSKEFDSNTKDNAAKSDSVSAVPVVDLSISKAVNSTSAKVGDTIKYTISVTNNGPCTATGINVSDELSNLVELVSATVDGNGIDFNGVWTVGNLASKESKELVLVTKLIGNGTIANTASVSANEKDLNDSNDKASSDSVLVEAVVNLVVSSEVNNTSPDFGDSIGFATSVTNNGPSDATNLVINVTVPEGLDGMTITPSVGTYDSQTSQWTIDSLNEGDTAKLEIGGTVNTLDPLSSSAKVDSVDAYVESVDYSSASSPVVNPTPVADLSVSISLSSNEVNYDDIVELVVTVKNNGPNDASGVIVKNTLPDGLVYVSDNITDSDYLSTKSRLMASSQGYDSSSGEWSVGDLANGDEASISILAKASFVGTKELKSTVSANELKASEDYSTKLTVDPVSDLAIDISVDKTEINVGDEVTYTITVSNNGPNDASGVKVTDSQLADFTFVSASSDDYDSSSGVWSVGELSNGSSVKLTVTVKIDNAGNYSNSATVSVNGNDVNSSNDEASSEIVAVTEAENNNETEPDNETDIFNETDPYNGPDINNETVPDNGSGEDVNPAGAVEPALAKTGNPILLVLLAFVMIISTNLGRRRK